MIYSVEDDAHIRDMILYALRQSGFAAEGFETAASFWTAMRAQKPSLILLDIMLPDEDGIAILRRLRGSRDTKAIPVMLLTAKGGEMDKVGGLNTGADDYLTKPFSVLELIARVQALLRRTQPEDGVEWALGTICLNGATRTVRVCGRPIALTYKEFELLAHLMRNSEIVCSREALLSAVWDEAYAGNTRTVDVHVQTLRQKLGDAGALIETVRGIGYRMRRGLDAQETD